MDKFIIQLLLIMLVIAFIISLPFIIYFEHKEKVCEQQGGIYYTGFLGRCIPTKCSEEGYGFCRCDSGCVINENE